MAYISPKSTPSGEKWRYSDWKHQVSQPTVRLNHCSVLSLILYYWYLFSMLISINILYKYSFQTYGKEEIPEARTHVLTLGF